VTTIERLERDVHSATQAVRALSDRGTGTLTAIEHDLWHALLAVGRTVVALYLAKQAARPRAAQYVHDGVAYVLDAHNRRKNAIGTRFGKVVFAVRSLAWAETITAAPLVPERLSKRSISCGF
jgi:hypothetical protein